MVLIIDQFLLFNLLKAFLFIKKSPIVVLYGCMLSIEFSLEVI